MIAPTTHPTRAHNDITGHARSCVRDRSPVNIATCHRRWGIGDRTTGSSWVQCWHPMYRSSSRKKQGFRTTDESSSSFADPRKSKRSRSLSAGHKIRFRIGNRMAPTPPHYKSLDVGSRGGGREKYRQEIRKEEKMDRKRSPFCTTFGGERGNAGAEIHTHYALPSAGKTAIQPRHGTYCSAQKSNDFYSWKRKDVKTSLPLR